MGPGDVMGIVEQPVDHRTLHYRYAAFSADFLARDGSAPTPHISPCVMYL